LSAFLLIFGYNTAHSFDTEIDSMRLEGLEKHDVSVFVEIRVEYIHSRIPLKSLITGIELARKMSNVFGNRSNSTFTRILNTRVKRLVAKTERKLKSIYGRDSMPRRKKRAIEFVGNLISKLFGNPGPEDWKQNKRNIIAMKLAIEKQVANSAIQHRDIDQNRHAINEQNEILRHVSKELVNNENRINDVDNALTALETYLELETMHNSIDEILESLLDIKRDAKNERCNEKGVNPEFLIEHLREMESNKNGVVPVFASWEWQSYYSFEMCTLAIHETDVWVTMRIPIVNMAEQFTRTIPTSNQLWIRNELSKLGLESVLFKNRFHDSFLIMMRTHFEQCSKLGSTRVCSLRNSKFKEANPYVVPIDINNNKILILSNSSNSLEVKSICNGKPQSTYIKLHTIVELPSHCAIMSKSLDIGRVMDNKNHSMTVNFGRVENVTFRQINYKNFTHQKNELIKDLAQLSLDFEINNNDTKKSLESISFEDTWSKKNLLITTSSSTTLVILIIVVIIVIVCIKKCRKSNADIVLEINNPTMSDENIFNRNGDVQRMNKNADISCDTSDLNPDDKAKKTPQFRNSKS